MDQIFKQSVVIISLVKKKYTLSYLYFQRKCLKGVVHPKMKILLLFTRGAPIDRVAIIALGCLIGGL